MSSSEVSEESLSEIIQANDLKALNDLLTGWMKRQKIQILIRGDNLSQVVERIIELASRDESYELYTSAILGRLAAVARGREDVVLSRATELFTIEPPSIETLADGDEKEYAAKVLSHVGASWLLAYCAREALTIDTANNARKELLRVLLTKSSSLSDALRHVTSKKSVIKTIEQNDARIKRVRRVMESLAEVVREYDGDIGKEPGIALAEFVDGLFQGIAKTDVEAIHSSFDSAIGILVRVIELRFSHALNSEIYLLLRNGKKMLSPTGWAGFISSSSMIRKVQMNLLESALVLARQNRTDKEILRAMESSWTSTSTISTAIKRHFKEAVDIDPEVADYWLKVGRVSQSARAAEHKLGNTEDQQIGELLIQLEANRDSMGKLNSAVVPILKTFDPFQAATVKRAAIGYESIAQVAERLARMRKLSKTDLLHSVLEYNPIEHDMEGGHRSGIRLVKVVRDGILKEFGGKKKTLVKPRVEPEEY